MRWARRPGPADGGPTRAERGERGQTLVEYTFIMGLISVLVVVLAVFMDTPLRSVFQRVGDIFAQL